MQEIIAKFSAFNNKEFVFLILFAVVAANLIYFLWSFFSRRSLTKNSTKTIATISEIRTIQGENGAYQELTLIFRDDKGMEFAPIFENMFRPRQRGERVEVLYRRNDPANVIINDWRSLHMKTFVSFLALLITLGVGYYMMQHHLLQIPAMFLMR